MKPGNAHTKVAANNGGEHNAGSLAATAQVNRAITLSKLHFLETDDIWYDSLFYKIRKT